MRWKLSFVALALSALVLVGFVRINWFTYVRLVNQSRTATIELDGTSGETSGKKFVASGVPGFVGDGSGLRNIPGGAYARTLTVAEAGGHFTTIQAALDAITDDTTTTLIHVYPGHYDGPTTITVDNVTVRGAGRDAVVIVRENSNDETAPPPDYAMCVLANNVSLENLTMYSPRVNSSASLPATLRVGDMTTSYTGFKMRNCAVRSPYERDTVWLYMLADADLSECYFEGIGDVVCTWGCDNVTVRESYLKNNWTTSNCAWNYRSNAVYANCLFEGGTQSFTLQDSSVVASNIARNARAVATDYLYNCPPENTSSTLYYVNVQCDTTVAPTQAATLVPMTTALGSITGVTTLTVGALTVGGITNVDTFYASGGSNADWSVAVDYDSGYGLKMSDGENDYFAIGTTGAIVAGTWQATPLASAYGGTGLNAIPAAGTLLYGSGSSPMSTLPVGAAGAILTSTGSAPQWSTPGAVKSTLAITGADVGNGAPEFTTVTATAQTMRCLAGAGEIERGDIVQVDNYSTTAGLPMVTRWAAADFYTAGIVVSVDVATNEVTVCTAGSCHVKVTDAASVGPVYAKVSGNTWEAAAGLPSGLVLVLGTLLESNASGTNLKPLLLQPGKWLGT
jgi:hypothetical protein